MVRWLPPSSAPSRPLGVTKWVWLSPSSLAFWFISSANCSTLPARCSASITAVSLCDSSIREYKRSLSLNFCPSTVPSRTLGWAAALALTDTLSSGSARSNARMQVMILVVLAIGRSVSAFFANKIRPLSASIKTADRAYNCPGVFSPYAIFVCSSSAYTHETGNRPFTAIRRQKPRISPTRYVRPLSLLFSCIAFLFSRHSLLYPMSEDF